MLESMSSVCRWVCVQNGTVNNLDRIGQSVWIGLPDQEKENVLLPEL